MKVSIQTIAELAGVSTATVSRVFHGDSYVKEETRQLIERIAEENGYKPRGYNKRQTARSDDMLIGVAVADITNPFLRMLAHLILLPLVVGFSYEFNRYAGRSESILSRALRWPGLMVQHLTVFEPDDSMIEVAITAMKAVIPDDGSDEW